MKRAEQLNYVQQSQAHLSLPDGGDENEDFDIDSVSYHEDNDNFDMCSHQNEDEIIFDNEKA